MTLQTYLTDAFRNWQPPEPVVLNRTKNSITLDWSQLEQFQFIADQCLYRLEKNDKLPKWVVVYRGGKTSQEILNLPPRYPHKFRLKVIIKATAVATLAERAIEYYGDENAVYDKMKSMKTKEIHEKEDNERSKVNNSRGDIYLERKPVESRVDETGDAKNSKRETVTQFISPVETKSTASVRWLGSQWSEQTWTSTDTDGTTVACFSMAVRCGYIKQVQQMLEERPELIGIVNSVSGYTPLATAVRGGDINTVRFLLLANAEVDQRSATAQTALHLAVLNADVPLVELLLEKGADFQAKDRNGLRLEHYAVDSCSLEMLRYIMDRGGDVKVTDHNGWTPLFRAVCQGARTAIVEELVMRGSDVTISDRAGLPLTSMARLLVNRHGRPRDSILRLVDSSYPHEKALANFTRLTKKIYNVHTLFKLPIKNKQDVKK